MPPPAKLGGKECTDLIILSCNNTNNTILRDTLKTWFEIVKKNKMEGDSKLLIWPSQSPNFGSSASDDTFIRWTERGITAICTLVEGKTFKSFEKLKQEFKLENRDLYCYLQPRHFYDKEVNRYLSGEINEMIVFLTDAYKGTPSRTVSKLYSSLQKCNERNSLYVKS